MQRRDFLRLALAGGAGLGLSGCGFRLRGLDRPGPPLAALALAGPEDEFSRLVGARLEAAGTAIRDDAPLVMTLGAERIEERRLSVLDAGSQERELTLTVPFSLKRRADGAYRLPRQDMTVVERYATSDDDLLAGDTQREAVLERLRHAAARRLLDRLIALDAP
ncbi:LPS assembly lipoprotein LptE [Halomonas beimenensis]|uniref:LPS-assembly lipoprotein LptE n=1 Tax=Halomonas beimenensis TaxID=475662 RepID=A0A291P8B0_9GAMM|nr:LPS assembly lipoprotein LptE [Halomonas beimenensis]ATJ83125.1 LPS-assembly lipoprotein RlpB precursor (Rare lipoprotein B) [Halomonas beimenensis]